MSSNTLKLFISFTFLLGSAFASTSPKVTLLYFKGNVDIINKSKTIKTKRGMSIPIGSTVKTAKNSLAIINIGNSSKLKLNEESEIKVNDVLGFNKKGKKSTSTKIYLSVGSLFSKVSKNSKKDKSYVVETKQVSLGIRGTEFFASFGKQTESGVKDFWMCVNEGKVEVITKKNKESVIVPAGKGVFIHKGLETNKPKNYAWTQDLNWKMDPKEGNLDNNLSIDKAYTDLLDQVYD